MASNLRLSRLNTTSYKRPRGALPWMPLMFIVAALICWFLGNQASQQPMVTNGTARAVVAKDLPLGITQSRVDASLAQLNADLEEDVIFYVTDQPLDSASAKDGAAQAGANVTVSLQPDSGRIGVTDFVLEDEQTNLDWDGPVTVDPKQYGVSTTLKNIDAGRLQEVALTNQTIGHGPQILNGIAKNIARQQFANHYRVSLWQWLVPIYFALAGISGVLWLKSRQKFHNNFFRYASARRILNTVMINGEVLEAASATSKSQAANYEKVMRKTDDAFRTQQVLDSQMRQHNLFATEPALLTRFENQVKILVSEYNKYLLGTKLISRAENRASSVYLLPEGLDVEQPARKFATGLKWVAGALALLIGLPLLFVSNASIGYILANRVAAPLDEQKPHYSSALTNVTYNGSKTDIDRFFDYYDSYKGDSTMYPQNLESILRRENMQRFPEDTQLVIAARNFDDYLTVQSDYTEEKQAHDKPNQAPNVSEDYYRPIEVGINAEDYYSAIQKIKDELGEKYVDPATHEVRKGYIVTIMMTFDDQSHAAMPLTMMPWYDSVESDQNPFADAWAHDGNYWVLFENKLEYVLTKVTAPFEDDMTYLVEQKIEDQNALAYVLSLWIVELFALYFVYQATRYCLGQLKSQRRFSLPLRSTGRNLRQLMLDLDDTRLDSLVATGTSPQNMKLADYEAALADAWFHYQALKTVPVSMRRLPDVLKSVKALEAETAALVAWPSHHQ